MKSPGEVLEFQLGGFLFSVFMHISNMLGRNQVGYGLKIIKHWYI